ncbi:hypothetical protein [Lysobacter xanthus]
MSAPSYRLQLEPREHYLFARVEGPEDTLEVSMAYWTEIEAACRARGERRLLVVEALAGNAAPMDMEQVVGALLGMGFHDIRVAFVDATEDAALLVSAELRAQRAGLVGRVFRRVDEAEQWLLADLEAGAADPVPAALEPPAR